MPQKVPHRRRLVHSMTSWILLLALARAPIYALHAPAVSRCASSQCARTVGIHCGPRLRKRDRVAQTFQSLWHNKEEPRDLPSLGGKGLTLAERSPVPDTKLLTAPVDASEQRAIEVAERVAMLKAQGAATVARRSAMATACAEKLAAHRDADLPSWYDAADAPAVNAAEEVAAHDAVAQEKQLDSSMAAAVQELMIRLGSNTGWNRLADFYGGRADGCLIGHL